MKAKIKDGRKVPPMPTKPAAPGKEWVLVKGRFESADGVPTNAQGVEHGRGWQGCWWWVWQQQNTPQKRKANAEARKRQRAAKEK